MAEPSPRNSTASTDPSMRPAHWGMCLLADGVLVVLFAVLGNISHESGLSPADIWTTAWPFLLGAALGWWVTISWRHPSTLWPSGVVLMIITVASGMTTRHFFTDGEAQLPFIVVAALTLAVLLLGRRLATKLLLPRRAM